MVNNSTTNSVIENGEDKQLNSDKKDNLIKKAIRDFTEMNLLKKGGLNFYNKVKNNTDNYRTVGIKDDFLKFKLLNEEFDGFKKIDINNDEELENKFLREVLIYGIRFENMRKESFKLIKENYEGITNDQENLLIKELEELPITELNDILFSQEKRNKFINKIFDKKATRPKEKDYLKFLGDMNIDGTKLNEEQTKTLKIIKELKYVTQEDITAILPLFPDLKQKQLLIKAFLPVITLQKLIDLGVLEDNNVKSYLKKKIKDGLLEGFQTTLDSDMEEIVIKNIRPEEIVISTQILPEEDVDKILNGHGAKVIAEELTGLRDNILSKEANNRNKFKKDKQGNITQGFIDEVKKDTKLNKIHSSIDNFKEGSVLEYKIKKIEGGFDTGYYRIDQLDAGVTTESKMIHLTNLSLNGGIKKNPSTTDQELVSYNDFYELLGIIAEGTFISKEEFEAQKQNGTISEEIEDNEINTLEDLAKKIDKEDAAGAQYKLETGTTFETNNKDRNSDDFGTFKISKLNKDTHQIWVTDGCRNEEQGPLSYIQFFMAFKERESKRMSKINDKNSFITALKTNTSGDMQKAFSVLNIDNNNRIIPSDRKDLEENKNFKGVQYFVGKDGTAIYIEEIKDGLVKFSTGKYNEGSIKKDKNGKDAEDKNGDKIYNNDSYKSEFKSEWHGFEFLYQKIHKLSVLPKISKKPVEDIKTKDAPAMKSGILKSYLRGTNFAEILKGGKQIIDFAKNRLEQGSKLNASKFAYGLGTALHLPKDVMLDLKSSVESADKKVMEEIISSISNLHRSEIIKKLEIIALNDGSARYELQAALIVSLKKFGRIYVGGELGKAEGSFMWYKKFGGYPNDKFMLQARKEIEEEGGQFSEEALLIKYFKKLGGDGIVNKNFETDVKVAWQEGRQGAAKGGASDTEFLLSGKARLNYAVNEMQNSQKYYHSIGALKNIWGKGGTATEMNKVPFLLVMSGISTKLNQEELRTLTGYFGNGTYSFPALFFTDTDKKRELFQNLIKELSTNLDGGAKEEISGLLEELRSGRYDESKLVGKLSTFWDKHGDQLSAKLSMTKDPEIFLKKDDAGKSVYQEYYKTLAGVTNSADFKINKGEIGNDVYNYDHSPIIFSGIKTFMDKGIRIGRDGKIGDLTMDGRLFETVIKGVKEIKNQKIDKENKENNKKYQEKLYIEYTRNIYAYLNENKVDFDQFKKTPFGQQLVAQGMDFDFGGEEINQEGVMDGMYDDKIVKSFNRYILGENTKTVKPKSTEEVKKKTEGSFTQVMQNAKESQSIMTKTASKVRKTKNPDNYQNLEQQEDEEYLDEAV
ncbi:MAG: hypothetical protein PHZ26_02355 [Candidatus Gracilibacteria bacterium]|nr:hypothetical protein [Candidatus Gracilibacteria bacterium]MDD2908577.1 hypothetical protein [Candidatus Gracilibacteria bacterium]